jgi:hypothetical protein
VDKFQRTVVGGHSLSRMIIGTNWFLGWSHTTAAKDWYITTHVKDRKKIADIFEVFLRAGVDTMMGNIIVPPMADAIKDAEDRTGTKCIIISTPGLPVTPEVLTKGWDEDSVARILDTEAAHGCSICMPHQGTTDQLLDRVVRKIRGMDRVCEMIRERGMSPGLSTHMPETIIYADESGLDVDTYISMFNSMGFLMQVEVDWIARIIHEAKKPVITIKPMAAGQLRPFQAMTFVWNAIRQQDMVTVGTMSPKEAEELIEISMSILERRAAVTKLQETRSKASLKPKAAGK